MADAPALAALGRDTFTATFGRLYAPADLSAYLDGAYGPAVQAAELADPANRHQLVEDGGELVGFAKLRPMALPQPDAEPGAFELQRLYLRTQAQGAGLGAALMAWALAEAAAAGAPTLYVGVWEENHRALRFYAAHGFQPVGRYAFEVGAARDAELILRRPL